MRSGARISRLLLACIAASAMLCASLVGCMAPSPVPSDSSVPSSFGDVVGAVMPSVVYVLVEYDIEGGQSVYASGSGVIMTADGYVLTNRHVVEGADRVDVTLQDRSTRPVDDFWVDDVLDLAVIKLDASDLPHAEFATQPPRVGDWVVALGHPFGLSPQVGGATVTAGIVSSAGRAFVIGDTLYYDAIQTDAAINPGNSGGPLVNLDGEVVGINSAGTPGAQSVGYALSAETVERIYDDLVAYGEVRRPYLGAYPIELTPEIACRECLERRVGVVLIDVAPGGPAGRAGLQNSDIVVSVGGEDISSVTQFIAAIWSKRPGDEAPMVVYRGGSRLEVSVVLGG
jgi:serine protease Do